MDQRLYIAGGHELSPARHPRRWRRRSLLVLVVAAPPLLAYLYYQGRLWYIDFRVQRFAPPAREVAYDDNPPPDESARLINSGKYGRVGHFNRPTTRGWPVARQFTAFGSSGSLVPAEFAVLFMRVRRPPGGPEQRMARVSPAWFEDRPDGGYDLALRADTWAVAGLLPGRRTIGNIAYTLTVLAGSRLRMFAGQSDPADESHFTIVYALDGRYGTIDGWVRDDSDLGIELRDRDGLVGLCLLLRADLHPQWEATSGGVNRRERKF